MSYGWLIGIIVIIALMYVMMIRPQNKRMAEQKALVNALQPGTRVLLNSGIIGTVRAVGDAQLVVELAPGTEVTVLKQVIVKTLKPDEEEFEYSDDAATAEQASEPDGSDNPALWSADASSQPSPSDPPAPSDGKGVDGTQTH